MEEIESGHPATTDAGLTLEPGHEDTAFFLVLDGGARFLVAVAKVGE